ncbi:Dam family site-specific DNA-(adenine-N6)-methyltransferase [Mycoplasmopsis caviae]|uniref:Site-specific DNA-methyltransferase (adenine-specific) n=1 Tax=Mycoplasmopsis caviae TaxID=55603 RepID=A0A3P8MF82_9BACT|nr:Dam family site-specific DNA-(adenine-N6)-methyltransferase [Mycoplasmopsis caviae]UUD35308.1 Dam family site-specific DNA-(adenine-N6)-methyltransferase [Mycoplasmopsis caviae]VDR41913.1 adenine-specific DNA methyltransferase [Mycoplasmopsis caviae]
MNSILKNVGNTIKQERKLKNMTQLELAKLSGVERTQLTRIENGKVLGVSFETIIKLYKAIGLENIHIGNKEERLLPFVKWAGGKTQLIDKLKTFLPKSYNNYFEPFVGGGALLLNLKPKSFLINDSNRELINVYRCLKNDDEFIKLKTELVKHENNHNEEYYYKIRDLDKNNNYNNLPNYIKAARTIYLNKTCFNGLYRVNSKGFFNVPSGKRTSVNCFDRNNFDRLKNFFNNTQNQISCEDFETFCEKANKNDFIYFDPPYDVIENKNTFISYNAEIFGKDEQIRLANVFKKLDKKGIKLMLSNHNTKLVNELYKEFNINVVKAKRMINSNGDGRGDVEEVIITNYRG